jgi:protoheme IX farnesyltransferase
VDLVAPLTVPVQPPAPVDTGLAPAPAPGSARPAAPGVSSATPARFLALTKPRIVALVVATTAAGYILGAAAVVGTQAGIPLAARLWVLFHALLGTSLVAGGTNALNQVAERDADALMLRTRHRPLPAGHLTPWQARTFAWGIAVLGTAELAFLVNGRTAILAAATLVVYVYAYTPLKRRTSVATLVGAIPGALPIVGGWTAAGAALDARAATLFAILFLWQIPHFLALSWMYRDDYARAGLRMLSVDDTDGRVTFRQAALNAAAMLPVALALWVLGVAGRVYAVGAVGLTVYVLSRALLAASSPSARNARRLFISTLVYLPALLLLMVVDRIV